MSRLKPTWRHGAAAVLASVALGGAAAADTEWAVLPGAQPFPPALQQRLERTLQTKPVGYTPRTRHVVDGGRPQYTNRLLLEPSPYLLQHAHNPVNWYAWGAAAFARAERENKPVLLSIGYSTCHWCHVMGRESFEDVDIAAYLNRHYVAIKVDREQRPDLDGLYMAAVHMLSGRSGWPMTVWLTPDREPFYGGTYFPPRDGMRGQSEGFLSALTRMRAVYHSTPTEVAAVTRRLKNELHTALAPETGDARSRSTPPDQSPEHALGPALQRAAEGLKAQFDETYGGFGRAPKFPRSAVLEFLMRYARRTRDSTLQAAATDTLAAMSAGGIYDQLGGGFHRYTTDRGWRSPHFEKMLYDNALLVVAYLEGYQLTQRPDFARVVRETLASLDRDMSAPGGGFFSAIDAESQGEEGAYYTWEMDELAALLSPLQYELLRSSSGLVTPSEDRAARTEPTGHVLYVARPLSAVATEVGLDHAEAESELRAARARLKQVRDRRPAPHIDTKVIAAWNGLAISAFARAAHVLNENSYSVRAARAARFVLEQLLRDGRLRRSALGVHTGGGAYLDDYAFLIAGLLDLYESTFEPDWLRHAISLQAVMDEYFWDAALGGYFLTAHDAERLLAREKPSHDGALPSGNAVAVANLLRLAEFTTRTDYRERARVCFETFGAALTKRPATMPRMLSALDFALDRPKEIAIVKAAPRDDAEPLLGRLRRHFLPNRVLTVVTQGDELAAHQQFIPWLEAKTALGGRVTAYVCERHVCALPTSDPDTFAAQLTRTMPLWAAD